VTANRATSTALHMQIETPFSTIVPASYERKQL